MKIMDNFIYLKILYLTSKELNLLKKELLLHNCKLRIVSKKELKELSIKQYTNTCFIYSNYKEENFKVVLKILETVDFLQILGVVQKNTLFSINEKEVSKYLPLKISYNFILRIIYLQNVFFKQIIEKKNYNKEHV